MRKIFVPLFVVLALCLSLGTAFAQPSAKVTANAGKLSSVEFHSYGTIFTQTIKTSEAKDLFIDVSLECGLTTNTKVMSKKLERAISEAEAVVIVKVLVDGVEAEPGEVIFARRTQALIAEFAGDIRYALKEDENGVTYIDEDLIAPEMLALVLDTMSANSFNFIAPNLSVGVHTIEVMANPYWQVEGEEYKDDDLTLIEELGTRAYLGKGSVTVESVRSVKGEMEL